MAEEKDIDELYKRTNDHEKRLTAVETERPYLKELLERAIASSESLASTMHEVQISMTGLNNKMESQEKQMKEMRDESKKIAAKVEAIDEMGKFDMRVFIKNNWQTIMILVGIAGIVLSGYIKAIKIG